MSASFESLQALAEIAPIYRQLRAKHPTIPARKVHAYIRVGDGESFEVFCCPGHKWVYTGAAYGGDDKSYHGEGRCYCSICGADGDA
jgi:hypothetical protein